MDSANGQEQGRRGLMARRRRAVAAVALVVVALLAAACGSDGPDGSAAGSSTTTAKPADTKDAAWDATVAKAKEEGKVVVYGGKDDSQVAALLDAFNAAYPDIKAEYQRVRVSELTVRMDQELGSDKVSADVLFTTAADWLAAKAAAGELSPPEGPGRDRWPEDRYADGIAQVTTDAVVLEYNTKVVHERPTAWDSLIDQPFGLKDNTAQLIGALYDYLETDNPGLLERYAAAKPRVFDQTEPAILSGEIAWAPWGQVSTVELQKAQGAPVDWVIPDSGTIAIPQSAVALRRGPHPAAGQVFLDFMMSRAGQAAINGNSLGISLVDDDIPTSLKVDPALLTFVDLSKYDSTKLDEIMAEFNRLFR
jgi:iron(III) transport system substrate-binding protein